MTILARIIQLFRADIHSLLDQVEEPSLVLRQALREMEQELADEEDQRVGLERCLRDLGPRVAETRIAIAQAQTKVELCMLSGEEQLARSMITTRLIQERQLQRFEEQRVLGGRRIEELSTSLEEKRNKIKSVRDKAEFAQAEPSSAIHAEISAEEIEVALLAERQRFSKREKVDSSGQ